MEFVRAKLIISKARRAVPPPIAPCTNRDSPYFLIQKGGAINLLKLSLDIITFRFNNKLMRTIEYILSILLFAIPILAAGKGSVEIGVNISSGPMSRGDMTSNNYALNGGWQDNTSYSSSNPYSVESLTASWRMMSIWQSGTGGFISYWFSDKIAGRLNLKYGAVSSAVTGSFLEWTLCSLGTDCDKHSQDLEACGEKGSIYTTSINPALQFCFSSREGLDVSIYLGPALFIDRFEVYMDVPIVITDDYYVDTVCHYTSYADKSGFLNYEGEVTSFGASGALLAHLSISSRLFLEGKLYFDLGAMPIYSVEDYDIEGESQHISLSKLSISENTKDFIRDWGFGIGVGIELIKPKKRSLLE